MKVQKRNQPKMHYYYGVNVKQVATQEYILMILHHHGEQGSGLMHLYIHIGLIYFHGTVYNLDEILIT